MADNRGRKAGLCRMQTGCGACESREEREDGMCMDRSCRAWMRRLQMIDFALADTVLYLDAYPECKQALAYYRKLIEEREQLLQAGKGRCPAVNAMGNGSEERWQWTQGPWPWQHDAN